VSLRRERKLRVFQPDAYFSIDFDERRGRVVRREPDDAGQPSLTFEDLEVREGDALEEEIEGFLQAGGGGPPPPGAGMGGVLRAVRARQPPPVTGWDGLRALEVAHVIRESVETEVRAAQA